MFSHFYFFDRDNSRWFNFSKPSKILLAHATSDVPPVLRQADTLIEQGYTIAGFISYEAASALDDAMVTRPHTKDFPLVALGAYPELTEFTPPSIKISEKYSFEEWQPGISRKSYDEAIGAIHRHIEKGNSYQVNYTFRLHSLFHGDSQQMFYRILSGQPRAYAAYIETDNHSICSFTPELFFRLDGSSITMRPMKGTAARGMTAQQDRQNARGLELSQKEQAENLMIVDMVRNDLGRIAQTGSVQAPRLLQVEKYPTVWQMTSDVTAETGASFSEIMGGLFPCASITGAPKVRTMQIIKELEKSSRGIYTGSIGYFTPQRQACFNVAIRTVVIEKTGKAVYGVGGGIVWDSRSDSEYEECLLKSRVLTRRTPGDFRLLETMLWHPQDGIFLQSYHLRRLAESAGYFDFTFHEEEILRALRKIGADNAAAQKVRLLLSKKGGVELQLSALEKLPDVVDCIVYDRAVDKYDPFLYHKTTHRHVYDSALQAAKAAGAGDALLQNRDGEITESALANVVWEDNGKFFTPPVSCGLLNGTYRQYLLDTGKLEERVLSAKDVQHIAKLWLINSVRKWRSVRIIAP